MGNVRIVGDVYTFKSLVTPPLNGCHGSHTDWKTWKNEETFFSEGILNRLEK